MARCNSTSSLSMFRGWRLRRVAGRLFPLLGGTGAVFAAEGIHLYLADGLRGDGDAASNGEIVFLGAPARSGVGINVAPAALSIAEGGDPAGYRVTLLARPAALVTITITTAGQALVTPDRLDFALDNWSVAQTVTVSAVNDGVTEGLHHDEIRHTVASLDGMYDNLVMSSVAVTITDATVPGPPTPTPTSTLPGGPTATPTPTPTNTLPGGATATPTSTPTPTSTLPGGPTATPTPTPTPAPGGTRIPFVHLPLILHKQSGRPGDLYLPIIARAPMPDLIVTEIHWVGGVPQIVIAERRECRGCGWLLGGCLHWAAHCPYCGEPDLGFAGRAGSRLGCRGTGAAAAAWAALDAGDWGCLLLG